jgi:hypothetical protein
VCAFYNMTSAQPVFAAYAMCDDPHGLDDVQTLAIAFEKLCRKNPDHSKALILTITENKIRAMVTVEECMRMGIAPLVIESKKDTECSRRGCWLSHQRAACVLHAASQCSGVDAQTRSRTIILEDDVVFPDHPVPIATAIRTLLQAYNSEDTPHLVMLGGMPVRPLHSIWWKPDLTSVYGFYECPEGRYMHAYMLSCVAAEKIAQHMVSDGRHVDAVLPSRPRLAEITGMPAQDVVIAFPQYALQRDLTTSNDSSFVYRMLADSRNMLGFRHLSLMMGGFWWFLGACWDAAPGR